MAIDEGSNNHTDHNIEFDAIWQNPKLEKKLTAEGDTIAYNPENKWTYFQIKPERQKLMHIVHGKFHPTGSTGHIWFDDGSFTTILVSKKANVFTRDFENAVRKKIELLERRDAEKQGRRFENMSPEEKRQFKLELGVKIQNGSSFLVRYIPPLAKRLENEKAPEKDPDAEPPMSKLFSAKPPDPKAQRANVHWVNGKPLSRNALFDKFVAPTEVQGITDDDVPVRLEGVIGTLEPPKQKNLKVAWRCRECEYEFPGHTFTRLTETLVRPKACPNCEQTHPNLFEEKHLRVNTRVIDLRNVEDTKDSDITTTPVLLIDYPEMSMPPNSKKKLPVIHPAGNQMTGQITIGGKVRIVGHTEHLSIENRQGHQSYSKTMLVAHHAEIENQRSLELTPQDIIAMKRFAGVIPLSYTPSFIEREPIDPTKWKKVRTLDMRATLVERLCKLVAPHLVFQPNEQIYPQTALLVATGAPEKKKLRGRITALAVGPPGTGKTELMYATMALRPQSKMVSGAGHATGNTATAVVLAEPDGTRKLHVGNVARARFGVCGVNEYDKFPVAERNRITLEVIDKGRIPLEKFGETRDIPAETSIFATINPRGNVWRDPKQETIHLDEIPLEPIEISRFDIILPYKDIADEKDTFDYSISKNEREERMERLKDEYEPIFLQKYIEYIRRIDPQMTDQASHALAGYYSMLHKKMKKLFDKRHQGSLERIAKAFARLQMLDVVDQYIAEQTQKFLNATLVPFIKNLEVLKPAQHVVYEQAIAYLKSRADSGKWTNVTQLLKVIIIKGEYRIRQWFIHGKDGKPKPLEVKWNWRFREVHDQLAHDSRLERNSESSELQIRWRKDQEEEADGEELPLSRGGEETQGGDVPKTAPDLPETEKIESSNIELEKGLEGTLYENDIESSLDYENFYFSDMGSALGTSPQGKTSPTQDKADVDAAHIATAAADGYMTTLEMLYRSCISVDLEWDQSNDNRIFQAAFKDNKGRTWIYHLSDDEFAGSEVDLIDAILRTLQSYRMVLGYFTHLDKSDWEVLDQRCRFWGIESPVNIFVPPVQLEDEEEDDNDDDNKKNPHKFISLRMKGYHGHDIIDVDVGMLHKKDIVRNFFTQNNIIYNSLELDTVARVRLGRGKFKGVTGANVASQKVELQKAYGKDDAELCYDLATENHDVLIAILDEIANIVHLPFQKVCNTGPARWWANYYRNVMHIEPTQNRVIPKKKKSHADKRYRGGKILPYERLRSYENVTVYDFRQLYPNTAIQNNIAPDVINCTCCMDDPTAKIVTNDRNINAKGYWTCRRQTGSYPQAVLTLTELRAHYESLQAEAAKNNDREKEIEYGLKQQACKLYANSGYGVFGNRHFEYADVRAAELITACGRTNLFKLRKLAKEKFGFDVIYGDTDSIFCLNSTPGKQKEFEELCRKPIEQGGLGIPARYEKTFTRLLLLSAKNYMGEYLDKKGKKQVIVKGLVGKKSNTPNWARQIFEQVKQHWAENKIDYMLSDIKKGVTALTRKQVSKEDLVVREKLGQDPETGYNKKKGHERSAAKVLGMRHKKRQGEAVEYLLAEKRLAENNYSFTDNIDEISLKRYKERLESATLKILYATGFDTEDIYNALGLKQPAPSVLERKLYGKKKKVVDDEDLGEEEGVEASFES